jgi:hypothetical protein
MAAIFKQESKFFKKVPGGWISFAVGWFFVVMLIVAIILHSLTVPVNWFGHFVSNLGAGYNGSDQVFSVGLFIQAVGLIPFFLHLGQQLWMDPAQEKAHWNNRFVLIGFAIAIVAIVGMILVALFSMRVETILMHAMGAMMLFFGVVIMGLAFVIPIERQKRGNWWTRLSTIAVGVFFVAFMAAMMSLIMNNSTLINAFLEDPITSITTILGGNVPVELRVALGWVTFFEWWFILAMMAWNLVLSWYSIKGAGKGKPKSIQKVP